MIIYAAVENLAQLGHLMAKAYLHKPSDFPTLLSLIRQHCLK